MDSPWTKAWQRLPEDVRTALTQEDLTQGDADSRIYSNMWRRHSLGKHTPIRDAQEKVHLSRLHAAGENTADARAPSNEEAAAIHATFSSLYEMAEATDLYNKTPIGLKVWCDLQIQPSLPKTGPSPTTKAIARYRHWKPRDSEQLDNVTQQEVDAGPRAKWADRIFP